VKTVQPDPKERLACKETLVPLELLVTRAPKDLPVMLDLKAILVFLELMVPRVPLDLKEKLATREKLAT